MCSWPLLKKKILMTQRTLRQTFFRGVTLAIFYSWGDRLSSTTNIIIKMDLYSLKQGKGLVGRKLTKR